MSTKPSAAQEIFGVGAIWMEVGSRCDLVPAGSSRVDRLQKHVIVLFAKVCDTGRAT